MEQGEVPIPFLPDGPHHTNYVKNMDIEGAEHAFDPTVALIELVLASSTNGDEGHGPRTAAGENMGLSAQY